MLDPKSFLKNWIETYFNNIKKDPQQTKQAAMSIFRNLGLDPSPDAVLCYIMGICTGSISVVAELTEYNRDDLTVEMMKLVYPKILDLKDFMN